MLETGDFNGDKILDLIAVHRLWPGSVIDISVSPPAPSFDSAPSFRSTNVAMVLPSKMIAGGGVYFIFTFKILKLS